MTNIKIFHNSVVRKFSIPESAKWSDLDKKTRTVFALSPTSKFTLSYTDEEEDVITISTDLELQELLSSYGTTTIKFTLSMIEEEEHSTTSSIVIIEPQTPPTPPNKNASSSSPKYDKNKNYDDNKNYYKNLFDDFEEDDKSKNKSKNQSQNQNQNQNNYKNLFEGDKNNSDNDKNTDDEYWMFEDTSENRKSVINTAGSINNKTPFLNLEKMNINDESSSSQRFQQKQKQKEQKRQSKEIAEKNPFSSGDDGDDDDDDDDDGDSFNIIRQKEKIKEQEDRIRQKIEYELKQRREREAQQQREQAQKQREREAQQQREQAQKQREREAQQQREREAQRKRELELRQQRQQRESKENVDTLEDFTFTTTTATATATPTATAPAISTSAIELAQRFQEMVAQFPDVLSHPEMAFNIDRVTEDILQNKPVNIERWRQRLISCRNAQRDSQEQQQQRSRNSNNNDEICIVNTSLSPPPREGLVDESSFDDKICQLQDMGFFGDKKEMIELLRTHNGDVGRVIETLIISMC